MLWWLGLFACGPSTQSMEPVFEHDVSVSAFDPLLQHARKGGSECALLHPGLLTPAQRGAMDVVSRAPSFLWDSTLPFSRVLYQQSGRTVQRVVAATVGDKAQVEAALTDAMFNVTFGRCPCPPGTFQARWLSDGVLEMESGTWPQFPSEDALSRCEEEAHDEKLVEVTVRTFGPTLFSQRASKLGGSLWIVRNTLVGGSREMMNLAMGESELIRYATAHRIVPIEGGVAEHAKVALEDLILGIEDDQAIRRATMNEGRRTKALTPNRVNLNDPKEVRVQLALWDSRFSEDPSEFGQDYLLLLRRVIGRYPEPEVQRSLLTVLIWAQEYAEASALLQDVAIDEMSERAWWEAAQRLVALHNNPRRYLQLCVKQKVTKNAAIAKRLAAVMSKFEHLSVFDYMTAQSAWLERLSKSRMYALNLTLTPWELATLAQVLLLPPDANAIGVFATTLVPQKSTRQQATFQQQLNNLNIHFSDGVTTQVMLASELDYSIKRILSGSSGKRGTLIIRDPRGGSLHLSFQRVKEKLRVTAMSRRVDKKKFARFVLTPFRSFASNKRSLRMTMDSEREAQRATQRTEDGMLLVSPFTCRAENRTLHCDVVSEGVRSDLLQVWRRVLGEPIMGKPGASWYNAGDET